MRITAIVYKEDITVIIIKKNDNRHEICYMNEDYIYENHNKSPTLHSDLGSVPVKIV